MDNVIFDRCNCIIFDWEGVDMDVINFDKTNVITKETEELQFEEDSEETLIDE